MEKDTKIIIKDNSLLYIYQKGQRIVTAIYMISNFFDTKEPIKWQLRKISTKLLSTILTYYKSSLSEKDALMMEINTEIAELRSLFDIAYYSGFISIMNYNLVSSQIEHLNNEIIQYQGQQLSSNKTLFSKEFFNQKKVEDKGQEEENKEIKDIFHKGHLKDIKDNVKDNIKDIKDNKINKENNTPNKRQEMIKDILSKGDKLTIREISEKLFEKGENVSEKTTQRELQKMHEDGQIQKEGERRWTVYYIENNLN